MTGVAPKTRDAVSNVDMGPPGESRDTTGERETSYPASPVIMRPPVGERSGKKFETLAKIEESKPVNTSASREDVGEQQRSKLLQILEPTANTRNSKNLLDHSKSLESSSGLPDQLDP